MTQMIYSLEETSKILEVNKETLRRWDNDGKLKSIRNPMNNYRSYKKSDIIMFEKGKLYFNETNHEHIIPKKTYNSIELFAGAGGLALGLEKAGFEHTLLNEIDKYAVETLKLNRPHWNIVHSDISKIDFKPYQNQVDLLTGGFPCQAFSYAGKKLGFEDTRGTLFFEYARALKEIQPKVFIAENVKGLLSHNGGKTLQTMLEILDDLGYHVYKPEVLKAIHYRVPQKRERLFIVGIKKELKQENIDFKYPEPYEKIYTLKDALKQGELFSSDVPASNGQTYPSRKKEILQMVPQGGYWRDLPEDIQKEYMQKSFYLGGGKTGMARRIAWDEPCLTLTCAPAQKQTERCHPEETRPFQVREYARIQTFPDSWEFFGSMSQQYKQIGNAVPVNLSYEMGKAIINYLNQIS